MKIEQILFADAGGPMPLFPWFQYASYLLDLVFLVIAWAQYANIKNQIHQWMKRLANSPSGVIGETFTEQMWQAQIPGNGTFPAKTPVERQRAYLTNYITFLCNLYLMLATLPFLFGFIVAVLSRYQKESFKDPEYWTIIFGFATSVSVMVIYIINYKNTIYQIFKIFEKINLQLLENGKGIDADQKLTNLKNENANLKIQLEELRKIYLPLQPSGATSGGTDPGKPEVSRGIRPPC